MKNKRYGGPTFHDDMAWMAAIAAVIAACCVATAAVDHLDAKALEAEKNLALHQAVQREIQEYAWADTAEMAEETYEEIIADHEAWVAETIKQEAERNETALIEQGYFRKDIPLTFLEQDYLHTACDEFGIDYHIMVGLIERETNFKPSIGDNGNAFGYCQIWPKWWSGLMAEIGAEDLMDPYDNFRTACAILTQYRARYGSIEAALVAYNRGHYSGSSTEYSRDVLARAEKWRTP